MVEPLLRRMRGIGRRLGSGQDVPPALIDEGLELWQAYQQQLHDPHIDQIRVAGLAAGESASDSARFGELITDVARARTRLQTMRAALSGYREDAKMNRSLLALILAAEAQAGLAWERFEEEYVRTSLPSLLTPVAVSAWNEALTRTGDVLADLRERVRSFRARTAEFSLRPVA